MLMAVMALIGGFRLLPEVLLTRRADRESWTARRTPLELERMFASDATRPRGLLRVRRHTEYVRSALPGAVPLDEWLHGASFTVRHALWSRRDLWEDIVSFVRPGGSVMR